MLYNVATGTPYTATNVSDEVTQLNAAQQPTGSLNSRTSPATQTLDFKVSKAMRFTGARMSAFVWVLNAFDTNNSLLVYQGTGSPYTTGYLNTEAGRAVADQLRSQGIDPEHA